MKLGMGLQWCSSRGYTRALKGDGDRTNRKFQGRRRRCPSALSGHAEDGGLMLNAPAVKIAATLAVGVESDLDHYLRCRWIAALGCRCSNCRRCRARTYRLVSLACCDGSLATEGLHFYKHGDSGSSSQTKDSMAQNYARAWSVSAFAASSAKKRLTSEQRRNFSRMAGDRNVGATICGEDLVEGRLRSYILIDTRFCMKCLPQLVVLREARFDPVARK